MEALGSERRKEKEWMFKLPVLQMLPNGLQGKSGLLVWLCKEEVLIRLRQMFLKAQNSRLYSVIGIPLSIMGPVISRVSPSSNLYCDVLRSCSI